MTKKISNEDVDIFKLSQRHYGPINFDKIVYYIEEDNKSLGFFAMYRSWLEYLYFADVCGYIPVIFAGRHFAYREEKKINGTNNPFEYYYMQPATISLKEAKISAKVIKSDIIHRKMVEQVLTGKTCSYKYSKKYLYMMGQIVKKYLKYNDKTKKYLDDSFEALKIGTEKVLGVHIRGTDFRAQYDNHPVYLEEKDCFKEIDKLIENGSYKKIFLATDDTRILKSFEKKYGEKLCYFKDVERGSTNRSVAFCKNNRAQHKYLLGLEVIRDMYTLSQCDSLVAGISQVPICAQINKISRGEKYEKVKVIDKGINRNNRIFMRYN